MQALGRYELVSLLGRGGMGEVWRAVDTEKNREIALKILGSWLGGDPDFVARFRRESALAARLNSPNIIPIHDYGEVDGRLFIDMPLVTGLDLDALINQGPLPPHRAVAVVAQTARALTTAHRAGMVHRDVKPSNILISTTDDGDDHAYLIDFGITKALDGTKLSMSGMVIGTPAYMAPECFTGDGDARSDIYSLGCILHHALTGQPPFTGPHSFAYAHLHQTATPPAPSALNPAVPPALDAVVARALAKQPAQRFPAAVELAVAARAALTGPPAAAWDGHPGPGRPPPTLVDPDPPVGPTAGRPVGPAAGGGPGARAAGPSAVPGSGPAPYPTRVGEPPVAAAARGRRRSRRPVERRVLRHPSVVAGIATATSGGRLVAATVTADRTLRVWEIESGALLTGPIALSSGATSVATARLGERTVLLTGGTDGTVDVRDLGGTPVGRALTGHRGTVHALTTAQLDTGPVVVTAGVDRTVRVTDLTTGAPAGRLLVGHTGAVAAVAVAQLGGRPTAVTAGADAVRLWDLTTAARLDPPLTADHGPDPGSVVAVATSTWVDGRPVAVTTGTDRHISAWDLTSRALVNASRAGHTRAVRAVAVVHHDGRPVAVTGGDDGIACLIDPVTGTTAARALTGHLDGIRAVATDRLDGDPVALTGGRDHTVRVWDLLAAGLD